VESKVGKGSTFTVVLPIKQASNPAVADVVDPTMLDSDSGPEAELAEAV
jgi:hypothetical protein